MATKVLTAFLGRDCFTNPIDIINPKARSAATEYRLSTTLAFEGSIFLPRRTSSTPEWLHFLSEGLDHALPNLTSSSVSAVLVIKYDNRLFAFTFGHAGRGMLMPGSFESDFGLKVVLNRVDEKQLKSIDTKTFEDIVVNTRKQVSRSSILGTFTVDISRDILRGVVGEPRDKTYFKRIAGAEAATFSTDFEFSDLGDICNELIDAYRSDAYRQTFEWVDRVKLVRDDLTIGALDASLLSALQSGNTGSMHLAPAKIVDWQRIECFSFTGSGKRHRCTYPELLLDGYRQTIGDKFLDLDIETIKRHSVLVKYADLPEAVSAFLVYECIVWDTTLAGSQYALMDGQWFLVDVGFSARVRQQADSLQQPGAYLYSASLGRSEEEYNLSVSRRDPCCALLDQKLIRTADMASPVECCDLFTLQGAFIHIKKRTSSATLSHLFSQGSVSAELFMQDTEFRAKLRELLTSENLAQHAALVPADHPRPEQFRVIYAIIARHNRDGSPPPLPFFSAVNLVQHYQRLRRLGLRVELRYIVLG